MSEKHILKNFKLYILSFFASLFLFFLFPGVYQDPFGGTLYVVFSKNYTGNVVFQNKDPDALIFNRDFSIKKYIKDKNKAVFDISNRNTKEVSLEFNDEYIYKQFDPKMIKGVYYESGMTKKVNGAFEGNIYKINDRLYLEKASNLNIMAVFFILLFLFFFKIFQKTEEKIDMGLAKRVDCVLVFSLAFITIILFSKMDAGKYSCLENRELVNFPALNSLAINKGNYLPQFEKAMADRISYRDDILKFYSLLSNKIVKTKESGLYIKGDNNWIFKAPIRPLSEKECQEYAEGLLKLEQRCKKQNIKLYVNLVPNARIVYPEYLPSYINKKNMYDNVDRFSYYLKKHTNLNVINPKEDFMKAKKDEVMYFKTDLRNTPYGAYINYKAIMKEIKRDFGGAKIVSLDDYNVHYDNMVAARFSPNDRDYGYLYFLTDIYAPPVLDVNYPYYRFKFDNEIIKNDDFEHYLKTRYYPDGYDKRVVFVGNCFGELISNYFETTFKNYRKIRYNYGDLDVNVEQQKYTMSWDEFYKNTFDFKPEIIILEATEDYLPYFARLN